MKRLIAGTLAAASLVGVVTTPASASDQEVATCNVANVMNHRLDELGRSGFTWSVHPVHPGNGAETFTKRKVVWVSPDLACDLVHDATTHEWMHTREAIMFPDMKGGKDTEMIADCGSSLLGSHFTPYIDAWGPCTPHQLTVAHTLIEGANLPINVRV